MPVIKARTRGKQLLRHVTRFDRENSETLYAYAAFLGEPVEYVLNQVVETVLGKDKDFVAWRATHPGSHVPTAEARRRQSQQRRRTAAWRDGAVPVPIEAKG